MRKLNAWLLVLTLALASCAACAGTQPPTKLPTAQCEAPVGLVERAIDDARGAMALPAAGAGLDIGAVPVRRMNSRQRPASLITIGSLVILQYDRELIEQVICRYGYDAAVGVFAHEYGHLLDGLRDEPQTELSADAWAGCAMAAMGGSTQGYNAFIASLPYGGDHPPPDDRALATDAGFNACNEALWQ